MSAGAPSFLFVPVSGPRGMGEYARSLAIATAVARKWREARIHFVLSRAAPYAASTPFPATLLPASATFHSAPVIELIGKLAPDVVVFDNAGRTAQLAAARAAGARVVFVSARPRQRRRAFRWRWMRLLDEHWIAYPKLVAGAPRVIERLKLRIFGRPVLRYLDVVLPAEDPALATGLLARLGLSADEFILVVPGGGSAHRGAEQAPVIFTEAARCLAGEMPTVLAGIADVEAHPAQALGRLTLAELAALMRSARLVIANGGSTLLQALACRKPCIAVPVAGDQARRIERCVGAGLAQSARLDAEDIACKARELLHDKAMQRALGQSLARINFEDGLTVAVSALESLLRARAPGGELAPGA